MTWCDAWFKVSLFIGALWTLVPAHRVLAADLRPVIRVSAETFIPFDAPIVAHGYAIAAGVDGGQFTVLAGAGGVLPAGDSRGQFGVMFLEGSWHPFRALLLDLAVPLSPYFVAGAALATPDIVGPRQRDDLVRWTGTTFVPMGMLGLGVTLGQTQGLFAALDWRLYNIQSTGPTISAGYTF